MGIGRSESLNLAGDFAMKKLCALMAAALLLGNVGCNAGSTPGGPGATRSTSRPALTTADDSFDLRPPTTETDLKQGETKTVTLGIDRGKNFDQDVKLDFTGEPMGVEVSAADSVLKAGAKDVQVTIKAAKDAALGKHTIVVNGIPAKSGKTASAEFTIQIHEAK
jgi:hypothetical protein